MKWIGQNIWDLKSRFRNEVYMEGLQASNSTTALVLDTSTGLIGTAALGSGSGGGGTTLPNLNSGNIFIGDVSNVTTQQSLSSAITNVGDIVIGGDITTGGDVQVGSDIIRNSSGNQAIDIGQSPTGYPQVNISSSSLSRFIASYCNFYDVSTNFISTVITEISGTAKVLDTLEVGDLTNNTSGLATFGSGVSSS